MSSLSRRTLQRLEVDIIIASEDTGSLILVAIFEHCPHTMPAGHGLGELEGDAKMFLIPS